MPTFEELWLKSPDLLGMNAEQIAKTRKLAKFIYNQVLKHAKKQKAAQIVPARPAETRNQVANHF